jgi:hypothetical protein
VFYTPCHIVRTLRSTRSWHLLVCRERSSSNACTGSTDCTTARERSMAHSKWLASARSDRYAPQCCSSRKQDTSPFQQDQWIVPQSRLAMRWRMQTQPRLGMQSQSTETSSRTRGRAIHHTTSLL